MQRAGGLGGLAETKGMKLRGGNQETLLKKFSYPEAQWEVQAKCAVYFDFLIGCIVQQPPLKFAKVGSCEWFLGTDEWEATPSSMAAQVVLHRPPPLLELTREGTLFFHALGVHVAGFRKPRQLKIPGARRYILHVRGLCKASLNLMLLSSNAITQHQASELFGKFLRTPKKTS